jgi:dTDP-4-amino-4,6-dideoxygalactose transaminase
MSKLTENLLHGIDYSSIKAKRTENFAALHKAFKAVNKLNLIVPEGAFMYPLYVDNGSEIRKQLQKQKIYIPTLWPDVFDICNENDLEYSMAKNILPIPVDQRYDTKDMEYIVDIIKNI